MRRLLLFAGLGVVLSLSTIVPATADPLVDTPSLGRMVWGMTGGAVVLPADAWEGYFPNLTSPVTPASGFDNLGIDQNFHQSGSTSYYVGDTTNANLRAWYNGTNIVDYNTVTHVTTILTPDVTQYGDGPGYGNPAGNDTLGWSIDNGVGAPKDAVWSAKVGAISTLGTDAQIELHDINGYQTLFAQGAVAGTTNSLVMQNPFSIYETSLGLGPPGEAFTADSQNLALNDYSAANQLYNHMKAYKVTSGADKGQFFVGLEDWNYDNTGINTPGRFHNQRFDWNDSVIELKVTPVPEPAFYQMAGLLGLGAFGLLRLRRRSAS